jgi:GDP-D-mannose dehydratase
LTRPEATPLVGDPGAAQQNLGWEHSIGFRDLVGLMVQHELQGTMD